MPGSGQGTKRSATQSQEPRWGPRASTPHLCPPRRRETRSWPLGCLRPTRGDEAVIPRTMEDATAGGKVSECGFVEPGLCWCGVSRTWVLILPQPPSSCLTAQVNSCPEPQLPHLFNGVRKTLVKIQWKDMKKIPGPVTVSTIPMTLLSPIDH